jgi:hypothetical protein
MYVHHRWGGTERCRVGCSVQDMTIFKQIYLNFIFSSDRSPLATLSWLSDDINWKKESLFCLFASLSFFKASRGLIRVGFRCSDKKNRVMHTFPITHRGSKQCRGWNHQRILWHVYLVSLHLQAISLSRYLTIFPPVSSVLKLRDGVYSGIKKKTISVKGSLLSQNIIFRQSCLFYRKINKIGTSKPWQYAAAVASLNLKTIANFSSFF